MTLHRLLAASVLLAPLALAGTAQAAPHQRHPSAHVRTATYRVAAPSRPAHHLRAARDTHRHVAQAHRHASTRRG